MVKSQAVGGVSGSTFMTTVNHIALLVEEKTKRQKDKEDKEEKESSDSKKKDHGNKGGIKRIL
jgi:hypothetical protein